MAFKFLVVLAVFGAASAQRICDTFGSVPTDRYIIQNNRWGTSATQCIDVNGNGFTIGQQDGSCSTNGAPCSYPSIYYGCHYNNCSPGTNLPLQLNQIQSASTSITYNFVSGIYDAAYDIWLDPNPNISGVNRQEIMIWFNRQGSIQPVGGIVGNANIGGINFEVWTGNNGGNDVISYVSPNPINSANLNLWDFFNDGISRKLYNDQWYLTSIQAGFEPWQGGVGLGISNFNAQIN